MPTRRTPANTRITEPSAAEQAAMELTTVQPTVPEPADFVGTPDGDSTPIEDTATYDWAADTSTPELFSTEAERLRASLYEGPQPTTGFGYVLAAVNLAGAYAPGEPDDSEYRGDLARIIADWAADGIQRLNTNATALDQIAADHRASVGQ